MHRRHGPPAGFSLIEMLIVISLMGILAAIILPSSNPSVHDQLRSAAEVLSADLAYGRSLSVTNNSFYQFTFDASNNEYVLSHSGANASLDTLPDSAFRSPDDPPEQHIVRLDELPQIGDGARIFAVGNSGVPVADLEFGPLGETTRGGETVVWIAAGTGSATRYISVAVNPVTGLAKVGKFGGQTPVWAAQAD